MQREGTLHRLAVRFPKKRRSLNVGEKERDRSRWKNADVPTSGGPSRQRTATKFPREGECRKPYLSAQGWFERVDC